MSAPLAIRVIHTPTEREPFVVVDKPAGLPSAPLRPDDDSALTQAVALFPDVANVAGKKPIEKGLVHRIDTATRGCVLIAATQEAYDFLLDAQKNGQFLKWSRSQVERVPDVAERLGGFPVPPFALQSLSADASVIVQSRFRGYGEQNRQVRPVSEDSGLAARKKSGDTVYQTEITLQDETTAICKIHAGYRHQVRCHLAWVGLPVQNDPLYNPLCANGTAGDLAFTAYKIAFPSPCHSGIMCYNIEV